MIHYALKINNSFSLQICPSYSYFYPRTSVQGQERRHTPPLKSIQVGEASECTRMDLKEMDMSKEGIRYTLVFQD